MGGIWSKRGRWLLCCIWVLKDKVMCVRLISFVGAVSDQERKKRKLAKEMFSVVDFVIAGRSFVYNVVVSVCLGETEEPVRNNGVTCCLVLAGSFNHEIIILHENERFMECDTRREEK